MVQSAWPSAVNANRILVAALYVGAISMITPLMAVAKTSPEVMNKTARERVLYSFQGGSDGWFPTGGVVLARDGSIYGTTYNGGDTSACEFGCGTIFRLTPHASGYVKTTVHEFVGTDGARPTSQLIALKDGSFVGVTQSGGASGGGTIFDLKPEGSTYAFKVLGSTPGGECSALWLDASGTFYGTCYLGGIRNHGVAFSLTPSSSGYTVSLLSAFRKKRGSQPNGWLVPENGILYGTTSAGGENGSGTFFTLTPSSNGFVDTTLLQFGGASGGPSLSNLIPDASGNFYGISGSSLSELVKTSGGYQNVKLYSFGGSGDGIGPDALMQPVAGTFYGETFFGGIDGCQEGCGTVFRLTSTTSGYAETMLYRFLSNDADGNYPEGGLAMDKHGVLYGVTMLGGDGEYTWCGNVTQGCGTVFSLKT